jgi:putative ABC transport system substrate-binding protein
MTTRRELLVALGVVVMSHPVAVAAQQSGKLRRIGFLSPFARAATVSSEEAFRQGLRELGWVEGKNIAIEYRYAEDRVDRLPDLAADLVRLKVDVIVTSVTPDTAAAQKATRTIPIVTAAGGGLGVFGPGGSLARPGGNVTGSSQLTGELVGKRLELLGEIVPKLSRVAVLWNPQSTPSTNNWKEMQLPARQLGVELHSLEVRSSDDFEKAFNAAIKGRASALILTPDPLIDAHLKPIADFAIRNRLPSIFHLTQFVEAGGLVAYGVNRPALFRRAAAFVDKILKGAKPGELPIEQASKFELTINLKTAKAIGISIPQSLLLRADKVIE